MMKNKQKTRQLGMNAITILFWVINICQEELKKKNTCLDRPHKQVNQILRNNFETILFGSIKFEKTNSS